MWIYQEKPIYGIINLPAETFGFIYKITNEDNGKIYVGKKQLIFSRKKKRSKKARKEKDSRRRFDQIITESDWKEYNSSCKALLEDIKNGARIKKEILLTVKTKRQLSYYEVKYQFAFNVLETDSYNDNIGGRYFRNIFVK